MVGLLDSISLTSDRFASVIPLELAVTFMVIRKAIGARPRENRRGAVLDSAARSFALHGYAGTSIRDIAADAGVQPSSLYYFFKSKDELLEKVVNVISNYNEIKYNSLRLEAHKYIKNKGYLLNDNVKMIDKEINLFKEKNES